MNVLIGPGGVHVAPFLRRVIAQEHGFELIDGQLFDPIIFWVHGDRQTVVGDREFEEVDFLALQVFAFRGFDRTRCVADVGLFAAEDFETGSGAVAGDLDDDFGMDFAKFLGDRVGDRRHGAGALHRDRAHERGSFPGGHRLFESLGLRIGDRGGVVVRRRATGQHQAERSGG